MLLCSTHHSLIDNKDNEDEYPAKRLIEIRLIHINKIKNTLREISLTNLAAFLNWSFNDLDILNEPEMNIIEMKQAKAIENDFLKVPLENKELIARFFFQTQQFVKAARSYDHLNEVVGKNANYILHAGLCYMAMGQYADALQRLIIIRDLPIIPENELGKIISILNILRIKRIQGDHELERYFNDLEQLCIRFNNYLPFFLIEKGIHFWRIANKDTEIKKRGDDFTQAQTFFNQARLKALELNNDHALIYLAEFNLLNNNFNESLSDFQNCLKISEEKHHMFNKFMCHYFIVKIALHRNRDDIIQYHFKKMDAIARTTYSEEIKFLFSLEKVDYDLKQYKLDDALLSYSNLAIEADNLGLNNNVISIYDSLASIYFLKDNFIKSREYLDKSFKIAELIGDSVLKLKIKTKIGTLIFLSCRRIKSYDRVISFFQELLQEIDEQGDISLKLQCLNILGNSYRSQEKLTEAMDYFNKSSPLISYLNDDELKARQYHGVGSVYQFRKQYSLSLDFHFRALAIEEKRRDLSSLAMSYYIIAMIYGLMEDKENHKHYTLKFKAYRKYMPLIEKKIVRMAEIMYYLIRIELITSFISCSLSFDPVLISAFFLFLFISCTIGLILVILGILLHKEKILGE